MSFKYSEEFKNLGYFEKRVEFQKKIKYKTIINELKNAKDNIKYKDILYLELILNKIYDKVKLITRYGQNDYIFIQKYVKKHYKKNLEKVQKISSDVKNIKYSKCKKTKEKCINELKKCNYYLHNLEIDFFPELEEKEDIHDIDFGFYNSYNELYEHINDVNIKYIYDNKNIQNFLLSITNKIKKYNINYKIFFELKIKNLSYIKHKLNEYKQHINNINNNINIRKCSNIILDYVKIYEELKKFLNDFKGLELPEKLLNMLNQLKYILKK